MTITSTSELALLVSTAAASYADFQATPQPAAALSGKTPTEDGFARPQVEDFLAEFQLLDHRPNTPTGFSATLFRRNDDSGQLVLSIRGTEANSLDGLLTDLASADFHDIRLHGFANQQSVDLYRYWRQLGTPPGQRVQYSNEELIKLYVLQLGDAYDVRNRLAFNNTAQNLVAARQNRDFRELEASLAGDVGVASGVPGQPMVPPGSQVIVTGHSLGGNLALLFDRLFPSSTAAVVTLNAPQLSQDAVSLLSSRGFGSGDPSRIVQLVADGDLVHVIGDLRLGSTLSTALEHSPLGGILHNHSSINTTDALNLMTLMGRLDTRLERDIEAAAQLVRIGSNDYDNTYEASLDALRVSLMGTGTASTHVATDLTAIERQSLYEHMRELRSYVDANHLTERLSIQQADQISGASARNDFSAMVALMTLNPYWIRGTDAAATAALDGLLQRAWAGAAAFWRDDRALTEAQRAAGLERFTTQWANDRAEMIRLMVRENATDRSASSLAILQFGTRYDDRQTGRTIVDAISSGTPTRVVLFGSDADNTLEGSLLDDRIYGAAGDDVVNSGGGADYVEGNSGNDQLNGEAANDRLLGGTGADDLDGGRGNDVLIGGTGFDRYVVSTRQGSDTIIDADGKGSVRFGNVILNGGTTAQGTSTSSSLGSGATPSASAQPAAAANPTAVYLDASRSVSYSVFGDAASTGGATVVVSSAAGQLRIENFHNGDLGITLNVIAAPAIDAPLTSAANYLVAPSTQTVIDGLEGDDLLISTSTSQQLIGGLGNDILLGRRGNDTIDGGAGNDFLNGGAGRDLIYGGSGNDVIVGVAYVDAAAGGSAISQASWSRVAGAWQWRYDSGSAGARFAYDTSTGDLDATWRITSSVTGFGVTMPSASSSEADISAPDRIFAGSGNDLASGGNGNDFVSGDAGDDVLEGNLGDDAILGGIGADEMNGGAGDDELDGGAGNDLMFGADGADRLLGGADADRMFGDWPQVGTTGQLPAGLTPARMGDDLLDGGAGDDQGWGGGGHDVLIGGDGNDRLEGDGLDTPATAQGNDRLQGGDGNDTLIGNGGHDDLEGGAGTDILMGDSSGSSATETAADGNDDLDGGAGDDRLAGQGGSDLLTGADGADQLDGGSGNDVLDGGAGNDVLVGGDGNDVLIGGAGSDTLNGGRGDDVYLYDDRDVLAGTAEVINDTSGRNTLQIAGTVTLASQRADGSLLLSFGRGSTSRGVAVVGGLSNAVETLTVNGAQTTMRDWVQTHLLTSVSANATAAGQYVFGGGGSDRLTASVAGTTLDGGRGSDTLTLASGTTGGTTVRVELGDGQDTVVGSVDSSSAATRQLNILRLGTGIEAASIRLVVDHGGYRSDGIRYLYYGDRGDRIRVTALGSNANTRPFDRITLGDGTVLTWDQIVARGIEHVAPLEGLQSGTFADDRITGGRAGDRLTGEDGNDVLAGGAGEDLLQGGSGRNFYRYERGDGRDRIEATSGADDTLSFGNGVSASDVIWARDGDDLIVRLSGSTDVVTVAGHFAQTPVNRFAFADGTTIAASALRLTPGQAQSTSGDDDIIALPTADTIAAAAGNDSVRGGVGNDVLRGDDGDDRLYGRAGNDTLEGGAGDDVLDGGDGADTIEGGAGHDRLTGGAGRDTFLFGRGDGDDWISNGDPAEQLDILQLRPGIRPEDVQLQRYTGNWTLHIRDTNDEIIFGNVSLATGASYSLVREIRFADGTVWGMDEVQRQALQGAAGDDDLEGFDGADIMDGGAGNDAIHGWDGNDVITGGHGNDELAGNAGDDTIRYRLGDGHDSILPNGSGTPGNDTLEFGPGIAPDMVTIERIGTELQLRLLDVDGSVSIGGYFGSSSTIDRIAFADGTVWTVDMVTARLYGGTAGIDELLGDDLDNILSGAAGDDKLFGRTGNDVLSGGDGQDLLSGADGNDTMLGGSGRDRLVGSDGDDIYRFGYGQGVDAAVEFAEEGLDRVVLDSDIRLSDVTLLRMQGDEALSLSGTEHELNASADSLVIRLRDGSELWLQHYFDATASDRFDRIQFADGTTLTRADVLRLVPSPASADALAGGGGNDIYTVDNAGDRISETTGGGVDLIRSSVWYQLPEQVENIELTGTSSTGAIGTLGDNVMIGNSGHNWLDNGGGGNDILRGGLGDDIYRVVDTQRQALDTRDFLTQLPGQVIERAGEGMDEIITNSLQYQLPDNVENLTVAGARSGYINTLGHGIQEIELRYSGNALDNRIDLGHAPTFNRGSLPEGFNTDDGYRSTRAVLDGGAGADTMIGSVLNDTYIVDNAGDRVLETAYWHDATLSERSGADRVVSSISWTLGEHLEELELTGSVAIDGIGNRLGNRLVGNAGANRLEGRGGDDRYDGGAGNDRFFDASTTSNDRYAWGAGDGVDSLRDAGGEADLVTIDAGVGADQLWWRRSGDNLELSVIGTGDRLTVEGWYLGEANRIETFQLANGESLQASQVQQLVDAMARFTPPAAGVTSLPPAYATTLQPLIAAQWN